MKHIIHKIKSFLGLHTQEDEKPHSSAKHSAPQPAGKAFGKVLNAIKKNPGLKANELRKKTKLGRNTVFLKLRELQKMKLVENKDQKYYAI